MGPGSGATPPNPGPEDFRNRLSTADQEGRRKWLFPRKPHGRFHQARAWLSVVLLAIMFAGPFVRIHGNPLLLLNIVERKFVILGQIFWPQDMIIFAVALLVYITGIIVFTAAYGRLWCGWLCPQTVLMEMVFRKIEYLLEGDAHKQRALARSPWNAGKILRKGVKHALFFALSFVIGNTLLAYIIGTEQLFQIITDNPAKHLEGLGFMSLFTLVFYGIFARFREQACTFICPYGRLQSTLLDENSIVVAYDYNRGELRGRLSRNQTWDQRKAVGRGDCIDCKECVNVCPTGIDIRNGTQMECVHCTACIDACDDVMVRVSRPKGLIRYASLNGIEKSEPLRVTPRLAGYTVLLFALGGLLAFLLFSRSDVEATILRAQGTLFQKMPDGQFSNLYTIRVVNKTSREIPIELKLENVPGELQVMGKEIVVAPQKLAQTSVLIKLPTTVMKSGTTPLVVGVYANGRKLQTVKTGFIGPREDR
ncbi:MAG: cytochrome c oxidase accessory protein CcoG [Verrucomicrobia bacterium]|nr:cytochrome c oxidase accessory protein CcoG [Verrucomicrobiota bacterium]